MTYFGFFLSEFGGDISKGPSAMECFPLSGVGISKSYLDASAFQFTVVWMSFYVAIIQ